MEAQHKLDAGAWERELARDLEAIGLRTAGWIVRSIPAASGPMAMNAFSLRASAAREIVEELGARAPRGDYGHRYRGLMALVGAWGRRDADGDYDARARAALAKHRARPEDACGDCAAAILKHGLEARCEVCEDEETTRRERDAERNEVSHG